MSICMLSSFLLRSNGGLKFHQFLIICLFPTTCLYNLLLQAYSQNPFRDQQQNVTLH